MTTTETHMDLVSCPKCQGAGSFRAFAHYANGVCFACMGAGQVRAGKAENRVGIQNQRTHRSVTLPSFGAAVVTRDSVGFKLDYDHGSVWFSVVAGKVTDVTVSDGPRRRGESAALIREIQAAVKL